MSERLTQHLGPGARRTSGESYVTRRLRELRLAVFDFDGVFTDNLVLVSQDGSESVMCCRSDGLGLRRLRAVGVDVVILSTEPNPVVAARARKLGVPCLHGQEDKLLCLRRAAARRRVDLSATAYVGNDINDADCLRAVGMPVVVADAFAEVRPLARLVLTREGGAGAVREFCDRVWAAKREGVHDGRDV